MFGFIGSHLHHSICLYSLWTMGLKSLKWLLFQWTQILHLIWTMISSRLFLTKRRSQGLSWRGTCAVDKAVLISVTLAHINALLICRNKRKFACGDEISITCQAMEGLQIFNGLECKIACNSYKVSLRKFNLTSCCVYVPCTCLFKFNTLYVNLSKLVIGRSLTF